MLSQAVVVVVVALPKSIAAQRKRNPYFKQSLQNLRFKSVMLAQRLPS